MKYIEFLKPNNTEAGGISLKHMYDQFFKSLNLDNNLLSSLKERIESNSDFLILFTELGLINEALENRLDQLVKHPDFNPFKEELRTKFKEQYESYPFNHQGTTYYLYSKGGEFLIDREIEVINSYKKIVEEHIENETNFKHIFKKYD